MICLLEVAEFFWYYSRSDLALTVELILEHQLKRFHQWIFHQLRISRNTLHSAASCVLSVDFEVLGCFRMYAALPFWMDPGSQIVTVWDIHHVGRLDSEGFSKS